MERHDIRKFRDRHGLTQEALAEHLGATSRTVRRWENSTLNPSAGMHERLQTVRDQLEAKMAQHPPAAPAKPTRRSGPASKQAESQASAATSQTGPKRRVAHLPGDQQGERTLNPLAAVLPSMGRVQS